MAKVNVRPFSVTALGASCVAFVMMLVSLATDYWVEGERSQGNLTVVFSQGLWRSCSYCDHPALNCSCVGLELSSQSNFYKATQSGVCLSSVFYMATVVTLVLFVAGKHQKATKISTLVFLVLAVCWNLIAVSVFAAETANALDVLDFQLSWSWMLAVFTLVIEAIVIVIVAFADRSV